MAYLRASQCDHWDRNSIELPSRPFTPVGAPRPWHSRTHEDYGVAPDADIVTKHGFSGSLGVTVRALERE